MPLTGDCEPVDSTTGSAFVWLVVNPESEDQDKQKCFSFYYLFTEITFKFEYRSSCHFSPNCPTSSESSSLPVYTEPEANKRKKYFVISINS